MPVLRPDVRVAEAGGGFDGERPAVRCAECVLRVAVERTDHVVLHEVQIAANLEHVLAETAGEGMRVVVTQRETSLREVLPRAASPDLEHVHVVEADFLLVQRDRVPVIGLIAERCLVQPVPAHVLVLEGVGVDVVIEVLRVVVAVPVAEAADVVLVADVAAQLEAMPIVRDKRELREAKV